MSVASRIFSEGEDTDLSLFFLAGPLSLLFTLSLALARPGNLDLFLTAPLGLFLSVSLRMRGLAYALLLLIIGAAFKHLLFLEHHHFWQLGIEASIAIAFILSAITADWREEKEQNLALQMQTRQQTLCNLEEEIAQLRQQTLADQMIWQEKLSAIQKELEEASSESSSLCILNDVLRKTAAQEHDALLRLNEQDRRISTLLGEIEVLQKTVPSQTEQERLLQELNAARIEREQTHLINQTLARMLSSASKKTQILEEQLKEKEMCDTERNVEIMKKATSTQALYWQLRKQFDTKNDILHQTRRELFRTDTTLQAMRLEQERKASEPMSTTLIEMAIHLQNEIQDLESENRILTELVSLLSVSPLSRKTVKRSLIPKL